MSHVLTSDQKAQLQAVWGPVLKSDKDQNTQAYLGGRFYRLNVFEACKAIWHTARVVFEINKAIVTGELMPWDALGIAEGTYSAICAGLSALSEAMKPLQYVSCIVLSSADQGMTPEKFEEELRAFLPRAMKGHAHLPWYLGLTTNRLTLAEQDLRAVNPFSDLIKALRKGDWLEPGDKLKVKNRNIVWGFDLTK